MIQGELLCRFGSSSSSVAAPEGAGFGVSATAVRQLVEGLLRQHLQLMLAYSQEVAAHVWQQLQQAATAAPAGPAEGLGAARWPHAEHPVWQQVSQYLQAQGGSGGDVLQHLQAAARSGSTGGDVVVRRCLLVTPPACLVDLTAALMVACK
jgi:hypothetical protein